MRKAPIAIAGIAALAVATPVLIALASVIALVCGAIAGWAGGWLFPEVFANLSDLVFGRAVPAWQIGAMLGFVSAFLHAAASSSSSKD
ncbi:MAG: hypothetical protein ACEQR8_03865 [Cypionkella sp.]